MTGQLPLAFGKSSNSKNNQSKSKKNKKNNKNNESNESNKSKTSDNGDENNENQKNNKNGESNVLNFEKSSMENNGNYEDDNYNENNEIENNDSAEQISPDQYKKMSKCQRHNANQKRKKKKKLQDLAEMCKVGNHYRKGYNYYYGEHENPEGFEWKIILPLDDEWKEDNISKHWGEEVQGSPPQGDRRYCEGLANYLKSS